MTMAGHGPGVPELEQMAGERRTSVGAAEISGPGGVAEATATSITRDDQADEDADEMLLQFGPARSQRDQAPRASNALKSARARCASARATSEASPRPK